MTSAASIDRQEKKRQILELRRAKLPLQAIADQVGLNVNTVHVMLKEIWAETGPALSRRLELLEEDIDASEQLWAAWYLKARGYRDPLTQKPVPPDAEATQLLLKIAAWRANLLAFNHKTVDLVVRPSGVASSISDVAVWIAAGWTADEVARYAATEEIPPGKKLPEAFLQA